MFGTIAWEGTGVVTEWDCMEGNLLVVYDTTYVFVFEKLNNSAHMCSPYARNIVWLRSNRWYTCILKFAKIVEPELLMNHQSLLLKCMFDQLSLRYDLHEAMFQYSFGALLLHFWLISVSRFLHAILEFASQVKRFPPRNDPKQHGAMKKSVRSSRVGKADLMSKKEDALGQIDRTWCDSFALWFVIRMVVELTRY